MRALLLSTILLGSCASGPTETGVCTDEARPAISALIQSWPNGWGAAEGSTLIAQDGAFVDSVTVPIGTGSASSMRVSTPNTYERPGTYTVTVRRWGYNDAVLTGIVVPFDGCHVVTAQITVMLTQ